MKLVSRLVPAFTLLLFMVGAVLAQDGDSAVEVRSDPALGHYLAGPDGMALYIFSNDAPGTSNCYDRCATNWPPLLTEGDEPQVGDDIAGEFGVTERNDGGRQVTYNGWPLYYWVNDQATGDTSGHEVGGVWWIANVNPVVQVADHPDHGQILVGPNGMTLYRFANDEEGMSNCADQCAVNWPPLMGGFDGQGMTAQAAEGAGGEVGTIERADGGTQITYDGMPLYYWVRDMGPGDATGHEVGGVWFVVNP